MKRFHGESKVAGGFYFNVAHWSIAAVSGREGVLEGPATDEYVKLAFPAMLLVALGLSLGYLIFLPFIGFAMVAKAAFGYASRAGRKAASDMLATVGPAWQPGEAHLTAKPEANDDDRSAAEKPSAELEKLRAEIAEKRQEQGQ